MENVIGVRFQEAGKLYYFATGGYDQIAVGEHVVVETSRGQEIARVVIAPDQVLNVELTEPLKPIVRIAYDDDLERARRLDEKAEREVALAREKARQSRVEMKIVSGSYDLGGERLTLLFTSEERIDFRDFVREFSAKIGAQVQLRQVGPRDQAKIVGGYGRCGRRLCCSSWLTSFPAISIKMAKEQDLPLNPSKISGQCGRLLCCLSYENDMYRQVKQALPKPGTYVSTPSGNARILSVNVPREVVTMQMETMQIVDIPIQELGMESGLVRILTGPPEPTAAPPLRSRPPSGRDRHPSPPPREPAGRGPTEAPVAARPDRTPEPQAPEKANSTRSGRAASARPLSPVRAVINQPPAAPTPAAAAEPDTLHRPSGEGHRRRRRRGGSGPRPQPDQPQSGQ